MLREASKKELLLINNAFFHTICSNHKEASESQRLLRLTWQWTRAVMLTRFIIEGKFLFLNLLQVLSKISGKEIILSIGSSRASE